MDTMYRRRTAGRGSRTGTRKKSGGMCAREKRRLIQLGASLALFLLVFFGRGVLPAQMAFWRSVLTADTDFIGAVTAFGQTLSEEGSVLEALEVFWADLTGLQENGQTGQNDLAAVEQPELPGYPSRAAHPAFGSLPAFQQTVRADSGGGQEQETQLPSEEEAVVTAVAQAYDDQGQALPERVSLQYYNLGLEETAVPVAGTVTSAFGFRDHPVDGDYSFHNAVDIGVSKGTDILAYADGTVRYIGEDDVFGLYLKIDHANGVSTFYAHCDKLLVSKGDVVTCGQVIAKSGETGNATGPHLHFSIEKDGIRLNPAYYLDLDG